MTIRTEGETFYDYNDTLIEVYFTNQTIEGGDSVFYFPSKWQNQENDTCDVVKRPFFLGHKMIKKTFKRQWYINRYVDTIRFYIDIFENIGSRYTLMKNDSLTFEAVFTKKEFIPFNPILGVKQNLITHTIEVKDTTGKLVPHLFQGKTFQVTQYHGFYKTYNWWSFPKDTSLYWLVGNNRNDTIQGTKGLSVETIFNILPGHERHYRQEIITNGNVVEKNYYKLLTLSNELKNDSTVLTNRRILRNIDLVSLDTTIAIDTVIEAYPNDSVEFLNAVNSQPGFIRSNSVNDSLYQVSTDLKLPGTFPRYISRYMSFFTKSNSDTCLSEIVRNDSVEYAEGLGIYFSRRSVSDTLFQKQLLYYKKGVEKWGTPLDFSGILGVEEQSIEAKIYPNPFSNGFRVEVPGHENIELHIFDVNGRLIRQLSIEGQWHINTGQWKPGVYLLQLKSDRGVSHRKLIKTNR